MICLAEECLRSLGVGGESKSVAEYFEYERSQYIVRACIIEVIL